MSYFVVEPPAIEATWLWVVPGPERTRRPSVVLALRLSCGTAVTPRPVRSPCVRTSSLSTQPVTPVSKRIWYQAAVAASWPRMS